MSATDLFKNLFQSTTDGDSSAPIIGSKLPTWIRGTLLYNGPVGQWDFEKETVRTWFDGHAILSSYKIDHDKNLVHFRKRLLQSDAHHKAITNGKIIITEFGTPGSTDPDKNFLSRMVESMVPGDMTDNCACSFYRFGDLIVASTETCLIRVIDPHTLSTKEKVDLSSLINIASARAMTDDKGDTYNLAGTFTTGIKYHFIKFPKSKDTNPKKILGSGSIVASINSRMKTCFSYYHTFGMSQNNLIMIEQPWVANSFKLIASKIKGLSFKDCLEWHPSENNKFHVVEKVSGKHLKTVYMSADPFYFLNIVNCFEDSQNNLVIDIIAYDSPDLLDHMELSRLRSGKFDIQDSGKLVRYVLPLQVPEDAQEGRQLVTNYGSASAVWNAPQVTLKPHVIVGDSGGCEHPTINPKFRGKKYKFSYVIGWLNSVNKGLFANAITKVNMDTGDVTAWRGGNFSHPSEAQFIPNPEQDGEESGIVVATVTDVRKDEKDYLVFLDPRNMTEIARANFDIDVPFTSHGFYFE